jgi:two-component system OmpR family sensor kinase
MVLDQSGNPVVTIANGGNSVRPLQLSSAQRHAVVVNPPLAQSMTTSDGVELRVSAQIITLPDGSYVVISGLSTEEIGRTLSRLFVLELIIGTSAVALAFVASSFGVRRSLRNLYKVTGTAQEVAAELSPEGRGLDRRVPVFEEGTEVGQLAESMNTLLAAVETQFAARIESEQRMRQFLADASHELRTPLTSIRGYAELARMQRAAGHTGEGTADSIDRIESEGTRMSRLVDDLLLLARGDADAAAAHFELIDVDEVLDDAVAGSRAAFPSRPIDVSLSPVPSILGDRDQLLRVVRNLITNAAVHTAAGRPILVQLVPNAGGATITVADGGPGLPAEEAAHVFERFWRADKARTRARGGSGLGLSIVSAIVNAHGGTVRFDSSVETGSTVTVWLPAATG